jgi:hypothetical protein
MKKVIVVSFLFLFGVVVLSSSDAKACITRCNTICTPTYGGGQTCHTVCTCY